MTASPRAGLQPSRQLALGQVRDIEFRGRPQTLEDVQRFPYAVTESRLGQLGEKGPQFAVIEIASHRNGAAREMEKSLGGGTESPGESCRDVCVGRFDRSGLPIYGS